MQENAVEFRHISMEFPGVLANDDVSLDIRKGEVFALVGENGAGKTTLMNILYGIHEPTNGEVYIRGRKVERFSPKTAISMGVGMVHQHFMLVPSFTVAQNIVMSREPRRLGVLFDNKAAEAAAQKEQAAASEAVRAETDFALPAFRDRRVRMDVADFQRLRVDIGEVPAAVHDEDRMVGTGCVDVRALQMPHLGDHAVVITVPDDPFARLLGLGVLADHVLKLGDVLDMVAGELEKFAFRPVGDVCVGFDEAGDEGLALKVNAFSVVRNLAEHVVTVPDCGDPVADGVYGLNRMPFGLHGQDRSVVEYLSVHCSLLVACPERHVLFSTW